MSDRTNWMAHAACKDHPNPDIFVPTGRGMLARKRAEEAARVCQGCPVRVECEDHRRRIGDVQGVWGGIVHVSTTPGPQAYKVEPPHGSNARYSQHVREGSVPCYRCQFAHRHDQLKWASA